MVSRLASPWKKSTSSPPKRKEHTIYNEVNWIPIIIMERHREKVGTDRDKKTEEKCMLRRHVEKKKKKKLERQRKAS